MSDNNQQSRQPGFLFHANMPYDSMDLLRNMEEEAWTALREALPDNRLPPFCERGTYFCLSDWICDLEEAKTWNDVGISIVVSKLKGVFYTQTPNRALRDVLNGNPCSMVNVSVSGAGLHDVKSVRVENDCCTDRLQGLLDKGWRLLAVCPPNDARRPDYILGHHAAGKRP